MTLPQQRFNARFIGVHAGVPVYGTTCDGAQLLDRHLGRFIGVHGGVPVYSIGECELTSAENATHARFLGVHGGLPVYGRSCCGETDCYVLQPEDLPTVTVSGWTQVGDWTGGDCCKCLFFEPTETPAWTEECSDVFGIAELTKECNADMQARQTREPAIAFDTPICPVPDTWCCPGAPFKIGEYALFQQYKEEWKLLVAWRPYALKVCISKQDVDCGGTIATKWVVQSSYCIDVRAYYTLHRYARTTRTVTVTHACFAEPYPTCDDDQIDDFPAACTLADAQAAEAGGLAIAVSGVGSLCFDRVKFYDTLPTGTITFTDSDVPAGCTWELCNVGNNWDTGICVAVSSWPCGVRPCWCDATVVISSELTPIVSEGIYCGASECRNLGSPLCTGVGQTVINTINCSTYVYCCCQDPIECSGYSVTCFSADFTYPSVPGLEDCCREGTETIGGPVSYFPVVGCGGASGSNACLSCDNIDAIFCVVHCVEFIGCTSTPCNTTCCWAYDCEDDIGVHICQPKYEIAMPTMTKLEYIIDCSITPVSICISSPSWSVTFS